jgi:diaminopimelate epimerase
MPVKMNNLGKPQQYDPVTGLFVGGNSDGNKPKASGNGLNRLPQLLKKYGLNDEQVSKFMQELNGADAKQEDKPAKKDLKSTILERLKK